MGFFQVLQFVLFVYFTIKVMNLQMEWIIAYRTNEQVLIGKLEKVYFIDTLDNLSNLSVSYNALTMNQDVNMQVTSAVVFNDLNSKYEDDDIGTFRWNDITVDEYTCVDEDTLSNQMEGSYRLGTELFWVRGGIQCLHNYNNKNSLTRDYINSFLIFEISNLKKPDGRLLKKAEDFYITALQIRATPFRDVRSYMHSYRIKAEHKTLVKQSIPVGKHWTFAVRQTKTLNFNENNTDDYFKYYLNGIIYVKYLKL